MKTRNGIYHDLTLSDIKFKVPDTRMIFVFSSELYRLKFITKYLSHRKEQNDKLTAKFRLTLNTKVLPDLTLYKKIETRGFLVINERNETLCQENLILSGEKATLKN